MLVFGLSKLLAFLPFGNIFKGFSGRLIVLAMIVGIAAFGVWKWKDNIKASVAEVFYQQQIEDHLLEVKTEVERLRRVEEIRNEAITKSIQRNESLILSIQEGRKDIADGKYEATPATPVLKDAMSRIKGVEAGRNPQEEDSGNMVIDAWKNLTGGEDE